MRSFFKNLPKRIVLMILTINDKSPGNDGLTKDFK